MQTAQVPPARPSMSGRLTVTQLRERWAALGDEWTDEGIRYQIRRGKLRATRLRKDRRRPFVVELEEVLRFEREHPRLRQLAKGGAA